MSFWRRLRSRFTSEDADDGAVDKGRDGAEEDDGTTSTDATPIPRGGGEQGDEKDAGRWDHLARVGATDGPSVSETLAVLRRVRGGLEEGPALTAALRAGSNAPEPVLVAVAEMLWARGDTSRASELLEKRRSVPALMLSADLAASEGDIAKASGTIERVLARDIDAPGARERFERWRRVLGQEVEVVRRLDEETVVARSGGEAPFRLVREIARGGAGTVYEAEDLALGRPVAFKVFHRGQADSDWVRQEVRLAAAWAGPGIVRAFDGDPRAGWVALEWVSRGSVRDVLARGEADLLGSPRSWVLPLARSLARIHALGWVHGDIKPANVLLRAIDDPVVGDFGVARPAGAERRGGSPGYVSPERLAGRPADPADDVYGYGRVLEDVANALDEGAPSRGALEKIALACLEPVPERPDDGAQLVSLVQEVLSA